MKIYNPSKLIKVGNPFNEKVLTEIVYSQESTLAGNPRYETVIGSAVYLGFDSNRGRHLYVTPVRDLVNARYLIATLEVSLNERGVVSSELQDLSEQLFANLEVASEYLEFSLGNV